MNHFFKPLITLTFVFFTLSAAAAPKQLITHNYTDVESNAFVAGTIPSQHPTRAHSEGRVYWTAVKMACFGHTVDGKCEAVIKMATNTPSPITLGTVTLDLITGLITPLQLSANGYTMIVNGPGETSLFQQ